MDKKKRPKGFRDNYLAPILAILMFLFWGTANAQVTPVAKVATITQLKAYNGTAAFVWVHDSLKLYTPCSPCTPDEVYVFAGAGGKNWQTDSTFKGSSLDTASLSKRIEERLKISDTASMLNGYLKTPFDSTYVYDSIAKLDAKKMDTSANIPLLDGANAWLATNRFNEGIIVPATKKITIYGTADETTNYRRLIIDNGVTNGFLFNAEYAGTHPPTFYSFRINNVTKMVLDAASLSYNVHTVPGVDNAYDMGRYSGSLLRFRTGYYGTSIGVGVTTLPVAGLQIIKATEQLRIGYDANNYWNATTNSAGKTTLDAVGSDSAFHFADTVTFAKGIAQAQVNNLADTLAQLHTDVAGKADTAHAIRIKTLSTNRSTSSTSSSAVTGMEFPVVAGKDYWFKFFVSYNSDATTTGSRWMIAAPTGGGTAVRYKSYWTLDADNDSRYNGFTGFNLPGTANASSLATGNIAVIEGLLRCGESGDMTLRFASEVGSSSITALAGYSFVQWQVVN